VKEKKQKYREKCAVGQGIGLVLGQETKQEEGLLRTGKKRGRGPWKRRPLVEGGC